MVTVNKSMNDDIKEFGVWKLYYNRIIPAPEIQSIYDYQHGFFDIHHYIKAQDYRRNRDWYEINGIEQKLILLPRIIHEHLENPIYELDDLEFFRKYHIRKESLIFNKRKWIIKQIEKEDL